MKSIEYNNSDEILIVEDSPTQAEMLKFLLEKHNYRVSVACNGREALDMLNKHKPMIVISDIVMPEMDGYQLCRSIKDNENLKDIPVILLTALSDPVDVLKGLECGADNFFIKPYDEKYLLSRIQYVLANRVLYESEKIQMGIEIFFGDQKYYITSERQQILNLLLSTYETAVQKNLELQRAQDELKSLNDGLENNVAERTASYLAELEERKRAEEQYRNLFDNANDAIITADLKDRITSWNNAAEKLFGWTAKEVIGKLLSHLIVPEYLRTERDHIVQNSLDGITFAGIETKRLRRDGTILDVSLTISPIRDADQKVIGLSGIIRDITDRKKAEETRLENLHLEASDKAKSEFLANMSHELRTPLNSSIGFSELLKDGMAGDLNEKQKHFVEIIITSNQFLLALINDILDLSKIEAGKIELVPQKMSVPISIQETFSLIKEKAIKHKVLLKTEIEPDLEFIEADKQRVKQILFNLLSNAVKFSKEEGGVVTITAKKEGDMAQISVSDTGIGIKEENLSKLFQKFEQLDSSISKKYGGTGLGLAISKQLVELHGGKIWAESKYGEGSTFTFMLPMTANKRGEIVSDES